jgi:hypothetical protein
VVNDDLPDKQAEALCRGTPVFRACNIVDRLERGVLPIFPRYPTGGVHLAPVDALAKFSFNRIFLFGCELGRPSVEFLCVRNPRNGRCLVVNGIEHGESWILMEIAPLSGHPSAYGVKWDGL